jgi:hypothetical protein
MEEVSIITKILVTLSCANMSSMVPSTQSLLVNGLRKFYSEKWRKEGTVSQNLRTIPFLQRSCWKHGILTMKVSRKSEVIY